jgi:hypothetical protein
MKNLILTLFLVFSSIITFGHDFVAGYSLVKTKEVNNVPSTFVIESWVFLQDTVSLSDSIASELPDSFEIDSISYINSPTVINKGDSIQVKVYLKSTFVQRPYFCKELFFSVNASKSDDTTEIVFKAFIFYTPWNTIEIWNEVDFYTCGRKWHEPIEYDSDPELISFSKSLIPSSNFAVNTNSEDWEYEYQPFTKDGMAFDVKMAAIKPEILDSLSLYFGDDSTWRDPFDTTSTSLLGIPTYTGIVKGKLTADIINDHGYTINMPLSGILVQIWELDFYGNEKFGEIHTDENGEFEIPYSKSQPWEGGKIELGIKIISENKDYNFVVSNNAVSDISAITFPSDLWTYLGEFTESAGEIPYNEKIQSKPFWGCHWIENAFRFADDMGVGVSTDKLKVLLNTKLVTANFAPGAIWYSDAFGTSFQSLNPTIRMTPTQHFDENTYYHEWGHYYLWALQNRNYIDVYNYEGLDHRFSEENHTRLAWSEGFANVMMMILDAHYWEYDNEYGFESYFRSNGVRRGQLGYTWELRYAPPAINNGFKSEYYFAHAVYDLWDGPSRGLPDPANNGTIPYTNFHPYDDSGISTKYKLWGIKEKDDIELDFTDLMAPVIENGGISGNIKNINEYFDYLLNTTYLNDCESRSKIIKCLYQNDIVLDISEKNLNSHNTGISSDNISFNEVDNDRGWNITEGLIQGFIDAWNPMVSGTFFDFLQINNANQNAWPLYDDYTIYKRDYFESSEGQVFNWNEQNGTLSDNLRLGYAFLPPSSNSYFQINTVSINDFEVETCGDVVIEVNNSNFIVGNNDATKTTFTLTEGATLKLDEYSVLKIKDNGRVVIGEGSVLNLIEGSTIILEGSNAVLEISGKVVLAPNAKLTFSGSGKVIFNDVNPENFEFAPGSSIELIGSGTNDVIAEVHQSNLYWFMTGNYKTGHELEGQAKPDYSHIKIKDGKVLLANNSRLCIDGPVELDNVVFDKLNATDKPRGLFVYGQNGIDISNCEFNNLQYGIRSENFFNGTFEIVNCDFNNCDYGLFTRRQTATVNQCNFNNCYYGWFAHGKQLPSTMIGGSITNCQEGIRFLSNTNLHLLSPNINNNVVGARFTGISLSAFCGDIIDNNVGIVEVGDELILSHNFMRNTGSIDLSGNNIGIAFDGTYLRLNYGNNDFRASNAMSSTNLDVSAQLPLIFTPDGRIINKKVFVRSNAWSQIDVPTGPRYQSSTFIGAQTIDVDAGFGLQAANLVWQNEITTMDFCPGYNEYPNGTEFDVFAVEGEYHPIENSTPTLDFVALVGHSNHEFQGQTLKTAISNTVNDMYDEMNFNRYTQAANRFADILRVAPIENNDDYTSYLLDYAYLRMMEAFGEACVNEDALIMGSSLASTIINVQSEIVARIDDIYQTNTDAYNTLFKYNMDLASTYWLMEDLENSTTTLSSMSSWCTGTELAVVNAYLCRINYENDVLTGNIPLENLVDSLYPCTDSLEWPLSHNGWSYSNPTTVKELENSMTIQLYPNPSVGISTIEIKNSNENRVANEIYTLNGQRVQNGNLVLNDNGIGNIDYQTLPKGIYLLKVNVNGLEQQLKLFKE